MKNSNSAFFPSPPSYSSVFKVLLWNDLCKLDDFFFFFDSRIWRQTLPVSVVAGAFCVLSEAPDCQKVCRPSVCAPNAPRGS